MEAPKGIITMTLVISRSHESEGPSVKRGVFVIMFDFFKVKTQLQTQVEEYKNFKAMYSPFMAEVHYEILSRFTKEVKCLSVSQVTADDIDAFHQKICNSTTPYTAIKHMQAIRAFLRFFKHKTHIEPSKVTNKGISLPSVVKKRIITPMIEKKVGRPANLALAKKVQRLKDRERLTFRAVGKALNLDVKSVYRYYKRNVKEGTVLAK